MCPAIIIKVHKVRTRKLIYTTLRKLSLNCHFIETDFAMGTKLWDIWPYFRSTEMCTAKRSDGTHNIVFIQRKEQQSPDYITWRAPATSKNPLNYRLASFWGWNFWWQKKKPVFGKKNSILFTVDLRILETTERLFGKPASYERATWLE